MSRGLSVPVGVSKAGRARVEDDPEQLAKIMRLELSIGDDDNPFQQLGIDEGIIFSINDAGTRGVAKSVVERIISKYRLRIRLDSRRPIEIRQDVEGEIRLSFIYIDLETGSVREFNEAVG